MTKQEQRNAKAYDKAVAEIEKDKVNEIKALVKDALERLHKAEADRREAVARIQTLKRDLDDLRKGRMEKIKERHEQDKKADNVSPFTPPKMDLILGHFTGPPIQTTGAIWQVPVTNTGFVAPVTSTTFATTSAFVANAAQGTYTLADGSVKSL